MRRRSTPVEKKPPAPLNLEQLWSAHRCVCRLLRVRLPHSTPCTPPLRRARGAAAGWRTDPLTAHCIASLGLKVQCIASADKQKNVCFSLPATIRLICGLRGLVWRACTVAPGRGWQPARPLLCGGSGGCCNMVSTPSTGVQSHATPTPEATWPAPRRASWVGPGLPYAFVSFGDGPVCWWSGERAERFRRRRLVWAAARRGCNAQG